MIHSIKRRVSLASHHVELQAEIENNKGLLARVKTNLSESVAEMDNANKLWLKQVQSQRTFSNTFLEGYVPFADDDATKAVAEKFATGSRERYDRFVRETIPEKTPFHRMEASVRSYIKEIEEIETMYPELVAAKSEVDRYSNKVDNLAKKKKDEEKTTRNMTKQETTQAKYDGMSKTVLDRQKATYAKAPVMCQMALVSFWEGQRCQLQIMQDSMRETSQYSESHSNELANLDVAKLTRGTSATGNAVEEMPSKKTPVMAIEAPPPKTSSTFSKHLTFKEAKS